MTIETGDPGVSGFGGHTNQANSCQADQSAGADDSRAVGAEPAANPQSYETAESSNGSHRGPSTAEAEADGHAEEVATEFDDDRVPGFEASASDCFNRAKADCPQSEPHGSELGPPDACFDHGSDRASPA